MADALHHQLLHVVGSMRALAANGVLTGADDTGAAQTVTLQTHDGAIRAEVEVAQPWGFSSMAPADGAVTVLLEIGGDPGNPIALPAANPYRRFGGLGAGETVMYGDDGSRVHIRAGGVIEIWGGASVTVNTQACAINAPNGCTITGNVKVTGSLTTTGDLSDSHGSLNRLRGNYDAHGHPSLGGGAPPSPLDPE